MNKCFYGDKKTFMKINKENIVATTFEIAKENGFSAITSRKAPMKVQIDCLPSPSPHLKLLSKSL